MQLEIAVTMECPACRKKIPVGPGSAISCGCGWSPTPDEMAELTQQLGAQLQERRQLRADQEAAIRHR
jgi:hypothetical protein